MKFGNARSTSGRILFSALLAVCVLAYGTPARAVNADENALVDGAKLCTRYLPRHERQYGIPEHLLAAIASTESGRFHRGLGLNLPWPWTINVNGQGYFFDTKEEAVAAVNKLHAEGYTSIDVGCMQVNLHHHPDAFTSVEQAFDPAYNVGYAASFLKRNFLEEGSWRKATGDYHSRTPSYASSYAEQVFGQWGRIVAKVADARAGRPILNQYAGGGLKSADGKPVVMASRAVRPSYYHALHMRTVSVTSRGKTVTRENGVLVIRPKKNDDMMVQFTPQELPAPSKHAAAVVHMISPTASDTDANLFTGKPSNASSTDASQGVKMVGLAGKAAQSGQFSPRPQPQSSGVAVLGDTPKTGNKLFVFDN